MVPVGTPEERPAVFPLFFDLTVLVGQIEGQVDVLFGAPKAHFPEKVKGGEVVRFRIDQEHAHAVLAHEVAELVEEPHRNTAPLQSRLHAQPDKMTVFPG
jgi:hypothetical protein